MAFIDILKAKAKANKKTIVLPETEDRRPFVKWNYSKSVLVKGKSPQVKALLTEIHLLQKISFNFLKSSKSSGRISSLYIPMLVRFALALVRR